MPAATAFRRCEPCGYGLGYWKRQALASDAVELERKCVCGLVVDLVRISGRSITAAAGAGHLLDLFGSEIDAANARAFDNGWLPSPLDPRI